MQKNLGWRLVFNLKKPGIFIVFTFKLKQSNSRSNDLKSTNNSSTCCSRPTIDGGIVLD